MKYCILFLLAALVSCNKPHNCEQPTTCFDGRLEYSSPAADGTGWSVNGGTPEKTYMLQDVPGTYHSNDSVHICLVETNIRYQYVMSPVPSNFNYYKIVSIRKL